MTWLKARTASAWAGASPGSARGRSFDPTYATLTFGTSSLDTVAYNMLDASSGTSGRESARRRRATRAPCTGFSRPRDELRRHAYLGEDGKYTYQGDRTGGAGRIRSGSSCRIRALEAEPHGQRRRQVPGSVPMSSTTSIPGRRPGRWCTASQGRVGARAARASLQAGTMTGTTRWSSRTTTAIPRTTPTGTTSRRASGDLAAEHRRGFLSKY